MGGVYHIERLSILVPNQFSECFIGISFARKTSFNLERTEMLHDDLLHKPNTSSGFIYFIRKGKLSWLKYFSYQF